MVPKSNDKRIYGLKNDALFEIYFYAEATANFNIVIDFFMERQSKNYTEKYLQSVGWLFTPIQCLPEVK